MSQKNYAKDWNEFINAPTGLEIYPPEEDKTGFELLKDKVNEMDLKIEELETKNIDFEVRITELESKIEAKES